jgi:hypothetical protein
MKTKRNKHTFSETDESSINTIKNNIEAIHMEQILFTKNDLAFFLNMGSDVAAVRYEGNSLHSLGP